MQEIDLDGTLDQLQALVGGRIEAVRLPGFLRHASRATAYVNDEGKFLPGARFAPNMRATDLMVPGVGLFPGDYIAGPMLLCGFDPETGEHAPLPSEIAAYARVIESEAAVVAHFDPEAE